MKTLKYIGLTLFQIISSLFSLIVIYLVIVMFAALIPQKGDGIQKEEITIFVKSNGVHTDFVLPVVTAHRDWKALISTSDYPSNSYNYISFGWGDQAFYIETPEWGDLTAETTINALFSKSPCAMHVRYFSSKPVINETTAILKIDAAHYKALSAYITSFFKLKDNKPVIIPHASYWDTDHFYRAYGNYHLFNTCNNWTNEGLKLVGVRTARFAVFPKTIISYCKKSVLAHQ